MLVLIMRHGEAESGPASRQDGERHLTKLGSAQVKDVLKLAMQMGVEVNAIASSPLTRAKETSEIASRIFKLEYTVTNSLEPEGSSDGVYEELLERYGQNKTVLLVSHQPLVSKLLADLTGISTEIDLATGSLAMVKVDGEPKSGCGTLVFLIPPSILIDKLKQNLSPAMSDDGKMETKTQNRFQEFVDSYLVTREAKCARHCESTTSFVPISQKESSVVGAYVCPGGYVSRVVYFADKPDPKWFEKFLRDQVGSDRLRSRDLRCATRYGWELGGKAEEEMSKVSKAGKVTEYYWTFYAKSDKDKDYGTFLCQEEKGGCGKLYTKLRTDSSTLCPDCRKSS